VVLNDERHADIPTTKELGYPEANSVTWFGLSGPKGLPDYVVKTWDDLVRGTMSDPEAQAAANKALKTWAYLPPGEFKTFVLKEYEQIISVATSLGIRK
jgi:tripartite-type tricarboxylate transporter receptor subunit TctC